MAEPLRVGLMASADGSAWLGGVDYINNLCTAVATCNQESRAEIFLFTTNQSLCMHKPIVNFLKEVVTVPPLPAPNLGQRVLRRLRLWNAVKGQRLAMLKMFRERRIRFIYPTDLPPAPEQQLATGAWIPDFQHRHLPELFTSDDRAYRDQRFDLLSRQASVVILSSSSAMEDFCSVHPERRNKARVLNFRNPVDPGWLEDDTREVRKRYSLPERYFIVCNQFWIHKNHMLVLEALGLLRERGHKPTIVFTGGLQDYRRSNHLDRFLQTVAHLDLTSQVRLLGIVPKRDQIQLIRGSLGIIQPSLFEGWSTIVEIARGLGKPILLSNLPVHVEQNPPLGRYFDPKSISALADLVEDSESTLQPGPAAAEEQLAMETNHREVKLFGRQFLEIVKQNLLV
ncbi:MAG: glycosyltransferase family 1 protein [Pirellulales bacterium]